MSTPFFRSAHVVPASDLSASGDDRSIRPAALSARGRVGTVAPLLAAGLASLLTGCIEEESVVLPPRTNELHNRSVRVDLSQAMLKSGALVKLGDATAIANYTSICTVPGEACKVFKAPVTEGVKIAGLRGVNGAPLSAVTGDDQIHVDKGFKDVNAHWARIPVGYGCAATLEGMFPDPKADVTKIANFKLTRFTEILKATREANLAPLWTAAYDIGDAGCIYDKGEQTGKPLADPVKYAKAVRTIAKYYDRDLPELTAKEPGLPCADTQKTKPWSCTPSLFNLEYGRDPFGAGGYTAETKAKWLEGYKHFALELRGTDKAKGEFPLPEAPVRLIGPSVVMGIQDVDGTGALHVSANSRSPVVDFIDFVVAEKLPLTLLSIEIKADRPTDVRTIAKAVAKYAALKGLRFEKNFPHPDGKIEVKDKDGKVTERRSDGTEEIPLWVTDLHLSKYPAELQGADGKFKDEARASAYLGTFFAASKMLLQGTTVAEANFGTVPRFQATKDAVTSRDSQYLWCGTTPAGVVQKCALKPAAWHQFWFHQGYLGGTQSVFVEHGPDPLQTKGGKVDSAPESGIVLLATRQKCVDEQGLPRDCMDAPIEPTGGDVVAKMDYLDALAKHNAMWKGRTHVIRVMVSDSDVKTDVIKEILEHKLRVQLDGIPAEAKTVTYRLAGMDGTRPTWQKFEFTQFGTVDVSSGTATLVRTVAVPSLTYVEFLY